VLRSARAEVDVIEGSVAGGGLLGEFSNRLPLAAEVTRTARIPRGLKEVTDEKIGAFLP
jgi:hypothetical protein